MSGQMLKSANEVSNHSDIWAGDSDDAASPGLYTCDSPMSLETIGTVSRDSSASASASVIASAKSSHNTSTDGSVSSSSCSAADGLSPLALQVIVYELMLIVCEDGK